MASIDHLVYAVLDLDAAIDDLERRLGVRAAFGGRHVGRGSHNALADLGHGRYLEIIATDLGQPAPEGPRPFGLDTLVGPCLVGWAVRTDDIDTSVAAARAKGYDPGEPTAMSRARPDGSLLEWRLTHNAFAGGIIPFLIDWGTTAHPSSTAPTGLRLGAFAVESPGVTSVTASLSALGSDVEVRLAEQPGLVASIIGPGGRVDLR